MSQTSYNSSFSGIKKQRAEVLTLISKNMKTSNLKVSGNTTVTNDLTVNGYSTLSGGSRVDGLQIGSDGSYITKLVTGTISVNPGSIPATTKGSVSITITDLNTNDRIMFQPPTGLNIGLLFCGADVTADDTVTIYLYNTTVGAIDDGVNTWKYTYFIID
jgi:hypothetical protein